MAFPVLRSIHVYPVKSLAAQASDEAAVEPWGLGGDRRWMLVDKAPRVITQRQQPFLARISAVLLSDGGIALSAPGRPPLRVAVPGPERLVDVALHRDTVTVAEAADEAHEWFGETLGTEARLVHLDDPAHRRPVDPAYARPGDMVSFADGYPLLLTTTASLDALNSLVAAGDRPHEGPLPMDRFRPNVVVDATEAWAEDGWRRIAVGDVPFSVVKPCGRCVITTTDQRTAERGKEPLLTLARHRRVGNQLLFGQNLVPDGTGVIRVGDPVKILD
ncbi:MULTISPECIES: MOSC N-terminal beta barrel domain-containing protein [Streptomyces]|uniref:MOSC domain-containing protein n=1 Tax=Streptomyces TaxID=1883 RepID=UPI000D514E46|nr:MULTISPECIES: MOSC N-terminal beta barrel domain-containing protein [Streptomyces]MXG28717.1 MOSC domain-containing protein [Streptomyces sp. YIM 132580]NYS21296.1 MOSC domain-containing protein [Streptomyces sp. SJ1-7]PVC63255.1 MOSC domain-containing protein [Streptomyces sp. CS065A]